MEMVSKMKAPDPNAFGSRIASVHNGSSLFTGDAGSGESNVRRHIIENDLLEAVVQLPNNLFYNTGITTYIWLLSNNKCDAQKEKVLLVDASRCFRKLRKNLGNKNCEFSSDHIREIAFACQRMRELLRILIQEHLAQRSSEECKVPVFDSDGDKRTRTSDHNRTIETVFGRVELNRTGYIKEEKKSLHPLDAELNLSPGLYSLELEHRVAQEAAKNSYEEVVKTIT